MIIVELIIKYAYIYIIYIIYINLYINIFLNMYNNIMKGYFSGIENYSENDESTVVVSSLNSYDDVIIKNSIFENIIETNFKPFIFSDFMRLE